jgi:hypothetical protein
MRNPIIIALCCVTLLAVAADLTFNRTVSAQSGIIHIRPARNAQTGDGARMVEIGGETFVGFACATDNARSECYVASR